eukprot:TRINITY_DN5444_c0_g1_i3.p1 TRINITY_DN5444_c0_g1~~TRINITY_DN5444_c0_g1_i3.p1  ORF type:complete len:353 (-),score=123.14 TRINITY_DN5444_c0_g1_i3:25-1083(-)
MSGKDDSTQVAMLLSLCSRSVGAGTIIFIKLKSEAHRMRVIFGICGLKVAELHGDMTQARRIEALQSFRDGQVDYLLATDVAARGLDIIGVETVINYNLPPTLRQYVHRVGRTARAGNRGKAISFVKSDDKPLLKEITKHAQSGNAKTRTISSEVVEKFQAKLDNLQGDLKAVLQQEHEEMEMRKATEEATRADNMIKHHDEIFGRPRKKWFLTTQEKEDAKKEARAAVNRESGIVPKRKKEGEERKRKVDPSDPYKGMSRVKRRREQAREDSAQYRREHANDEVGDDGDAAPRAAAKKKKKKVSSGPAPLSDFQKELNRLEKEAKAAGTKVRLNKKKGAAKFKSKKRYSRK